jgi:hypothetical protein
MVIETGFSRRGRGDDARGGGVNVNVNVDVDVAGGEPAGVDVEPTKEVPVEAPLTLDDPDDASDDDGGTSKLLVTHICTALLAHVVVPTTAQHTPGLTL